jgi:hypothetical protein
VAVTQLLYFTWLSGDHIVEQHVHNIQAREGILTLCFPGLRQVEDRMPDYGYYLAFAEA